MVIWLYALAFEYRIGVKVSISLAYACRKVSSRLRNFEANLHVSWVGVPASALRSAYVPFITAL